MRQEEPGFGGPLGPLAALHEFVPFEASVASEDFVLPDSHEGSVFGANAAEGLDLRVAMQVGLRKRHCIAGRFLL